MRRKPIVYTIPFVAVWFLTLLLLIYIGYGESRRTYAGFQMEKLRIQSEIMQIGISAYLQAGLPLHQFSGFSNCPYFTAYTRLRVLALTIQPGQSPAIACLRRQTIQNKY